MVFLEAAANVAAIVQAVTAVIDILGRANSARSCVLEIINHTDVTLNKVSTTIPMVDLRSQPYLHLI
jgi:hypothetical protein